MRADRPIPGNPWPHDMVIQTQEGSDRLLDLLWVREAWALKPEGEGVPPRLDPPVVFEPTVHSLRRDKRELNRAWQRGLTTIVPIPCAGTFTRTIGAHALLVTSAARRSRSAFSAALDAFDPVG